MDAGPLQPPAAAATTGVGALSAPTARADLTSPHEVDLATDRLAGQDLHDVLTALRGAAPLADTVFFGQPAVVTTTHALGRAVLRDDDGIPGAPTYTLSTAPLLGNTFIDAHGDEHHRIRALATPAFRSRAIERFDAEALVDLADEVLERVADRGTADLMAEFAMVVPYLAIARKLGLPPSGEDDTRRWAQGLLSHALAPDLAAQARADFDAFLGEIVQARRAAPRQDVLSGLVTAERNGRRFSDDDVLAHVRLLFAVGATTTAHGIGNLLSALLHRPDVFASVAAEESLRDRAVAEALRFDPPVSVLPRVVTTPTTVAGRELPPHTFLLVGIAAANRDPAVFTEPDAFTPSRPPQEVLTFGNGVKFCPGSHLATRELRVALDAVVSRLGVPELVDEDGALPVGGPLRAPERLAVRWDPVSR